MTCCADDITFMGLPCKWAQSNKLAPRSWVTVTAKISVQYHDVYRAIGPVLTAVEVSTAEPAEQDVCTF